jgi:HEAT repeat protein
LTRLIKTCRDRGDGDPDFFIRALQAGNRSVVSEAAVTLGKMRERRAVEPLAQLLSDGSAVDLRTTVAEALQRIGDPRAIPALIRCSEDRKTKNKELIADAAAHLIRRLSTDPAANLPVLVNAARADDVVIAVEAVRLLRGVEHPASIEALLRACLQGESELSVIAGPALARLGGPKVLRNLVKYLEYGDAYMARGIEDALVAVGSEAVDVLAKVAKWRCRLARRTASRALGRIGGECAVEVLKNACNDDEPAVRASATAALQQLQMSSTTTEL